MIGHQYVTELAAAERRHQMGSDAALYHASQAVAVQREARRARRRPSLALRLARRLAKAPTTARAAPLAQVAPAAAAAPTA